MTLAGLLVRAVALAVPLAAFVALLPRAERRHGKLRVVLGTLALGALAFTPVAALDALLHRLAIVSPGARPDVVSVVHAMLVIAPLGQAMKLAAVLPVRRSRHLVGRSDGVVYAMAAALGFVTALNLRYLFFYRPELAALDIARTGLAVPAHLFFAAVWGYALGRDPRKRIGGGVFTVAFFGATVFNGIYDHVVFARGPTALVATAPILACIGTAALLTGRDMARRRRARSTGAPQPPPRLMEAIAPPSIGVMRQALRRTEGPLTLSWIAFGALVTTGVLTAALVVAVAAGQRAGVDFSAVEREASAFEGLAPLALLGGAALAAFPAAGYLVSRASAARSVVEPAISAAVALAGALILLGLAAPVSVVFAIAFAPVAFGLACVGAWFGMTR